MEFLVNLNKVEDVKEFVKIAERFDSPVVVRNIDRTFSVDGTSLMGLFSLDLSMPVIVSIPKAIKGEKFKEIVKQFIV